MIKMTTEMEMRQKAVSFALQNKPTYITSALSGTSGMQPNNYDLIKESEKIYQYLIKGELK